jgi:hypothetical protein
MTETTLKASWRQLLHFVTGDRRREGAALANTAERAQLEIQTGVVAAPGSRCSVSAIHGSSGFTTNKERVQECPSRRPLLTRITQRGRPK